MPPLVFRHTFFLSRYDDGGYSEDEKTRARGLGDRHTRFYDATRSRLSIIPFATGPKRSMGHLLGAKKINFFNLRY